MADDLFANIEITPREVKSMLERGDKFLFVDVREKWEFETSWIEGAMLVPMREIPSNLAKFEQAEPLSCSVITASAASTRQHGYGRKKYLVRNPWPGVSIVGRLRLIPTFRVTRENSDE